MLWASQDCPIWLSIRKTLSQTTWKWWHIGCFHGCLCEFRRYICTDLRSSRWIAQSRFRTTNNAKVTSKPAEPIKTLHHWKNCLSKKTPKTNWKIEPRTQLNALQWMNTFLSSSCLFAPLWIVRLISIPPCPRGEAATFLDLSPSQVPIFLLHIWKHLDHLEMVRKRP